MLKRTLSLHNLKCGGCASTIINALSKIDTLTNIKVDIENELVSFDYKSPQSLEQAIQRLQKLGYPLATNDNHLRDKAKSYLSCAIGRISKT